MNRVFSKMFLWMFLGLMVTFGVAYFLLQNDTMMYNLFSGKKYMIVWIAEIVVVLVLSLRIHKLSLMSARILFILYSLLTGLTVSTIFIVYSFSSIIYVFFITSILFLIFGLIGYFTKIDLSRFGTILAMALLGGIICTIINIFIKYIDNNSDHKIYDEIDNVDELGLLELDEDKYNWLVKISNYKDSFINRFILAISFKTKYKNIKSSLKNRVALLMGNR